jgi:hypothetical protein
MMMRHMRLMMHQHMRMMTAMDDDSRMMIAVHHAAPGRDLLALDGRLFSGAGLRGCDAQKAAGGYDRECVSDFHDDSSTS